MPPIDRRRFVQSTLAASDAADVACEHVGFEIPDGCVVG
jgi:hypothetical protein